jgi:hypothetical protein
MDTKSLPLQSNSAVILAHCVPVSTQGNLGPGSMPQPLLASLHGRIHSPLEWNEVMCGVLKTGDTGQEAEADCTM